MDNKPGMWRVFEPERFIMVNFQFEFEHRWPEAPPEVHFLRHKHRHMMHVRVLISVQHNDRELEFIMVKRDLQQWVEKSKGSWPLRTSCEDIAQMLTQYIRHQYGSDRFVQITVLEDGENGAVIRWYRDILCGN